MLTRPDDAGGLGSGWRRAPFAADGITHEVLRRGTGPGVVLVPELPGATPQVMALADRVVADGFRVAVASVIGVPGREPSPVYLARSIGRMCVAREFAAFARAAERPVSGFLRALARDLHAECEGGGIGVIGMCFSGGFALAAAVEPAVLAPVVSQPAMPPAIGRGRSATGLSARESAVVGDRAREEGLCALGLRFTRDRAVPAERFAAFAELLGDGWRVLEIDSAPGNAHGIPTSAHSVLTHPSATVSGHPTAAANAEVLAFLHERLDG